MLITMLMSLPLIDNSRPAALCFTCSTPRLLKNRSLNEFNRCTLSRPKPWSNVDNQHVIKRSTRITPIALAAASKKSRKNYSPTIQNRAARFRYDIIETYECGIELLGTEVKSIREGGMNLKDGYARVKQGELFLHNVHITGWATAHKAFNHDPIRVRRLLLHKRSIRKLEGKQTDAGLTIVPLRAYFSENNYLKLEIGLARGKKLHDKREDERKREADRDIRRAVKSVLTR